MRIIPISILASIVLSSILFSSVSGEGKDDFEFSSMVLVRDFSSDIVDILSIDHSIVAWSNYSYTTAQVRSEWIDMNEMKIHIISEDAVTYYPRVSDGRISYYSRDGFCYLFDTRDGSTVKMDSKRYWRIHGDMVYDFNDKTRMVDFKDLSGGGNWSVKVLSNDIDLSGHSLASVDRNRGLVEVTNIEGGVVEFSWRTSGDPGDISICDGNLVWIETDRRGQYGQYVVVRRPGQPPQNVTVPGEMDIHHVDISDKYAVWTGKWRAVNVSANIFIYDLDSGSTLEVPLNETDEYYPTISGNRTVCYSYREGEWDIMLVSVLSDPPAVETEEERMDLRSVLGPTLALDFALVTVCLALALLPERSPWRASLLRRTGPAPSEERLSVPGRDRSLSPLSRRPKR